VLVPLAHLQRVLRRLAAGDRSARADPVGPPEVRHLVTGVVSERTAHLLPAADAATPREAVPRIHIGPLPVVRADPGMIRQLLDNLIGNALKYTRVGQPADIGISATQSPDGTVDIQIADRGIGIPADEQADVFTSFHRAHTGRGYAGTGLGLAICQRVVDRHGGTIRAEDNPGGGTRIRVMLPVDGPPGQPLTPAANRTADRVVHPVG
jgi:signal transduction histidine kinase